MLKVVCDESDPNATSGSASCSLLDEIVRDGDRQMLAMAFKLLQSAERRWRAVHALHLVALVRAGVRFDKGVLVERPDDHESRCDRHVA